MAQKKGKVDILIGGEFRDNDLFVTDKVKFVNMDSTFDVITWKGDLLFKYRKADKAILFGGDIEDNAFSR